MRDNHTGYPEILDAYQGDGLFYGVVRIRVSDAHAAFQFGVTERGYYALKRILQARPLGTMPGVPHRCFFTGVVGVKLPRQDPVSISIRIEAGADAKNFDFECPLLLARNLLWFMQIKEAAEAGDLRRVEERYPPPG